MVPKGPQAIKYYRTADPSGPNDAASTTTVEEARSAVVILIIVGILVLVAVRRYAAGCVYELVEQTDLLLYEFFKRQRAVGCPKLVLQRGGHLLGGQNRVHVAAVVGLLSRRRNLGRGIFQREAVLSAAGRTAPADNHDAGRRGEHRHCKSPTLPEMWIGVIHCLGSLSMMEMR